MNNTKWKKIVDYFYSIENNEQYGHIKIPYNIKTIDGYESGEDILWEHLSYDCFKQIDWLYIVLTKENCDLVLTGIKKIHVPGEIIDNKLFVYGYRNDVNYII